MATGPLTPEAQQLALILRESDIPFFTNDQLQHFIWEANGDVRNAAYVALTYKAENTTLALEGLTLPDTSKYFLRLASHYRPFHSGVLKGG